MTRRIDNPDTAADIELRGYLDAAVPASFIMVAGAGSGKTTSLVKALDHIGKTHGAHLRLRSQRIACITYTEIAVAEIRSDVGGNPLFHVSTIHSFLWALVKPFQKDIAAWVRQRIASKLDDLRNEVLTYGPRVQQKTRDRDQREMARLEEQLGAISGVTRFRYESGSDYSEGILGHDDIIRMGPYLIKEKSLLAAIVAETYPFFFVDESQDTFPEVVDALRLVARQMAGRCCLGFFGDPMQQIYMSGVGAITPDDGWKKITKPENFRCPAKVLSVINNIRSQGDGLSQTQGRQQLVGDVLRSMPGTANVFVFPPDSERSANLNRTRSWLADRLSDPHWISDSKEADVRILVIVHRMAAFRLGFPELFSAFNDGAPEAFKTGFREGNAWALAPFLVVLLQLASAFTDNRQCEVMSVLRAHCPRLEKKKLKEVQDHAALLASLKDDVRELVNLMSNSTVGEVLSFISRVELVELDERIKAYTVPPAAGNYYHLGKSSPAQQGAEQGDESTAMAAYLACPARQLWGYQAYMKDESPYSTQQGIKGAEFERVIVVLDDEEGRHNQFSYEKLLGLKPLSKTDTESQQQRKDTVLDRTRRLFYVCCSRAKKDLAVVLYSTNVGAAAARLKETGLFEPTDVHTLSDMV